MPPHAACHADDVFRYAMLPPLLPRYALFRYALMPPLIRYRYRYCCRHFLLRCLILLRFILSPSLCRCFFLYEPPPYFEHLASDSATPLPAAATPFRHLISDADAALLASPPLWLTLRMSLRH